MASVTRTAARQAPRALKETDDVAVGDATGLGVARVHARDFAAAMLGVRRSRAGCAGASSAGR
jgi:hypothetical protein